MCHTAGCLAVLPGAGGALEAQGWTHESNSARLREPLPEQGWQQHGTRTLSF